jgi:DNA-binding SARP family transcriptional activator
VRSYSADTMDAKRPPRLDQEHSTATDKLERSPRNRLEVLLLGPLVVRLDGRAVVVSAAKERVVLSLLALRLGSAVSTDALTAALWGDEPPRTALRAVHTYVSNLRRVLPEGAVVTVPGGYRADLQPEAVDTDRFERAVRAARLAAGDASKVVALLEGALALWRGSALHDLAGSIMGSAEVARLEELRRAAEEDLHEARLARGDHGAVVSDLEAAAQAEPLRERRWAQLILGLYRCGRQADALRAYQRLRATLRDGLGIEPSPALRDLESAVLAQDGSLDWSAPASQALPLLKHNGGPGHEPAEIPSLRLPHRTVRAVRAGFVSRSREAAQLLEAYWRASSAEGRAGVLIAGGPEVGQTALIRLPGLCTRNRPPKPMGSLAKL